MPFPLGYHLNANMYQEAADANCLVIGMSAAGTKLLIRDVRSLVAIGGKPDVNRTSLRQPDSLPIDPMRTSGTCLTPEIASSRSVDPLTRQVAVWREYPGRKIENRWIGQI
jgi:hypothetical protein